MRSVALVPAIPFLFGTWVGVTFGVSAGSAAVAVLWIASIVTFVARHRAITTLTLACGFGLAGAALGQHAASGALEPPIRALLDREIGGFALSSPGPPVAHEPITIRVRLLEDAIVSEDGVSVHVALHGIALRGPMRSIGGRLRLSIGGDSIGHLAAQWRRGRVIEVPVTFRRPARYLNEGVDDFERALAMDGIALYATAKSGLLVRVVERGSWFDEAAADVRASVRREVRRWVGRRDPVAAAIVTAVLVGDRTGLPDDIRARLQASGTYHVIAISGGNIAILASLIAVAFIAIGLGGRWSAAGTIAGLVAYAAVVNAGPSVWRATTTAVAYLAARLMDHRSPPWNAMAVSAMVLTCAAPLDVRDVGFALTFGATAAIIEAAQRVRATAPRAAAWVWASVAASAAVEVTLLPVNAAVFSRVTFAGLVLNLIAVPLMTVAQLMGLIACVAGRVDSVAACAGFVAAGAARGLVETARLVEIAPWLALRVPPPAPFIVVGYYVCLIAALWLPRGATATVASRAMQRLSAWSPARGAQRFRLSFSLPAAHGVSVAGKVPAAATLLCGVAILTGATPAVRSSAPHDRLQLTMFDVGQGEALLLQTAGGRAVMVDTGGVGIGSAAFDIGGRVLAPAVWARGVRALDVLALTHGDPDHIGGAAAVLRDFAPAVVWEGIPVPRHVPLQSVLAAARAGGGRVEHPRRGARIDLDGASIRVLHPPDPDWERQRVRNDDSLILEVRHGDVSLLLTGDASAEIERGILGELAPARVRVLKVGHHGSRTSTSQELVDIWKPQIAVISCGRGNRFGHPATEVVERLQHAGVRVYRTDRNGQITLSSDGRTVRVSTFSR